VVLVVQYVIRLVSEHAAKVLLDTKTSHDMYMLLIYYQVDFVLPRSNPELFEQIN
jgi:hypothetical protein